MALQDRKQSPADKSPSSLLPDDQELPYYMRREGPSKQGPSSLLPEAPGDPKRTKAQDDVVAVSPSSLLPEPPADVLPPKREELAAISPSELLPPAPPARPLPQWVNWRVLGGAAIALVVIVLGVNLASRVEQKSAPELMMEALVYLQSNNRTAAAIQLKNVLQIDPDNVQARVLHGQLLVEAGEWRLAEDDLRRAQQLGAEHAVVAPLLARALIGRKEYQEALDTIAPPQTDAPAQQSPEVIALRGLAMLAMGQKDKARELFESVLASNPDQPDALLGLARVAVVDRDNDWAMKSITRAAEKAPNNADVLALLADLTRIKGDEAKAAEIYEKALGVAPNNHAMRLSLASIYFSLKDYDKASEHLNRVVKAVPESPTAYFMLAMIDFRREKFGDARNLAAKVLHYQGNHVPSLLMVGASAYAAGEYAVAEKALRRALVLAPQYPIARKLLGASLVRTNRPREAIEQLEPLLKRLPNDPEMYATLGEAYLAVKEYGLATDFLERAAALAPDNATTRMILGRTRLASNNLDQAVADFESAHTLAPKGSGAQILLAMTHIRRKEFDRAIALLNTLPDRQKHPVLLNLLGGAHLGKKDTKTAAEFFERALKIAPDYMPAVLNLVQIDVLQQDPYTAARRLRAFLKISPDNLQAMFALASVLAHLPGERGEAEDLLERAQHANPDSAEPLIRLARYHLSRGATKEALAAAERGLQKSIVTPDVLDEIGRVFLQARAHRRALDVYVRMVGEYPKSALAHYRLGLVQYQNANSAGARQSLRNALALRPDYVEAKLQLAQIEVRAGNTAHALQLAEEIQKQLPKSSAGLSLKGDVLALSNRMAEAIPAFEAAFALEKEPKLVLKLHQAYASVGKIERGEKIVDDWLQQNPGDLRTRRFIADYSLSVKRYKVAQKHYEALAAAVPKDQQVLNNLAIVYDEQKDPRALETADRAHQLNPRNPFVADTYAWMLVRLGRPERGRDILKEAVAQAGSVPDMRYHYAVALAKSGQRKEARSEVERAFSLKGKLSYEAEAKALLEQLKN